jgi:hypothetical protein
MIQEILTGVKKSSSAIASIGWAGHSTREGKFNPRDLQEWAREADKFSMKALLLGMVLAMALPTISLARGTSVRSYRKRNGTVVHSHRRSEADSSFSNNWSTKGNVNPHTGKRGTKTHRSPRRRKK